MVTGRDSSRGAKTEIKVGYSTVIVLFVCRAPSDGWTHSCPETALTINPHDNPQTQSKELVLRIHSNSMMVIVNGGVTKVV